MKDDKRSILRKNNLEEKGMVSEIEALRYDEAVNLPKFKALWPSLSDTNSGGRLI